MIIRNVVEEGFTASSMVKTQRTRDPNLALSPNHHQPTHDHIMTPKSSATTDDEEEENKEEDGEGSIVTSHSTSLVNLLLCLDRVLDPLISLLDGVAELH